MSDKYKIHDVDKAYFVTLTVVGWIDVFTRNNPVEEKIVSKPEDYIFSSARNYAELESILEVSLISSQWKTYG